MDIQKHQELAPIDWSKVKAIVCGISASLDAVCAQMPAGSIKNILCGVSALLDLVCGLIPSQ